MRLKRIYNILLYTFIIVVPLIPNKVKISFIPISCDLIFGGLLIIVGMIYIIKQYKNDKNFLYKVLENKQLKILTLMIAVTIILSIISIYYSYNKIDAITETLRFLEYIGIFYTIIFIANKNCIKNSLNLFYIVMIIAAFAGIFQFTFNLSSFHDVGVPFNRGRIYSTFVNPNYWGAAVNLVIFYPLINLLKRNNKHKLINLLIFILFLLNLILCYTRGSWIGFAVGIIILAILFYKKIIYLIPSACIVIFAIPQLRRRFLSIFDMNNWTNSERFKLWKTGFIMFKEHFLLGVGNGNYLDMYSKYIKRFPNLYLNRDKYSVHNSYIKMLAELGIFGGIIFISIYLFLFYISYKNYKSVKKEEYKICALSLMCFWGAYIFQNFFNNLIFIPQLNIFTWILTALLFRYNIIQNNDDKVYAN